MKKILGIVFLSLFFGKLGHSEPVTVKNTKWHHMDIKKHFEIVTDNVRAGKSAQKFEIRHGECKKQDCKWGAHRTERHLKKLHYSSKKFKDPVYYSISLYIPKEFGYDFVASKMSMFQAKMKGVDMPLWMVSTQGYGFQVRLGHYKRCDVHSFKKETWNDFIIKTNYSRERVKSEKYFELWWNGEQIDECTHYSPFVTQKHIKESKSHGWSSNKQQINMRYGIYKFKVGDYLTYINKNKPKNMKTMTQPSGQENIIKPFKYKWQNKIPTTVMLFDEVRFGNSYEEVDINNNNPVD